MKNILDELRKPFHPSHISWKPGATKGDRAMALAYADLRAYMNRLDEVCSGDWSVAYEPWGADRIICQLTIGGVTRSSTGEMAAQDEKNEMGGTVAEAQSFKRACAMFGLGRYLYTFPSGWEEYDPSTRRFTDKAKAKLNGMLMQHYRRATENKGADTTTGEIVEPGASVTVERDAEGTPKRTPILSDDQLETLQELGRAYYGEGWGKQQALLAESVSTGAVKHIGYLLPKEADKLIAGLHKRIAEAEATAQQNEAVAA